MTWWIRPGPRRFCAIRKPEPLCAERVRHRHPHVRVPHLAVRRPAAPGVAEHRHRPDDVDARRVDRDDDLRCAGVRRRVGIGDRHDDAERRALRARREPLVAVDHPVVAVAYRARPERRRVGARHFGLGHREERANAASDEWEEPPLLLLVGAEQVEDLGIAGVRRLAAEDQLAPDGAADLLVQVGVVQEAGAGAARFRRHVRRPEPERPDLLT